MSAGWRKQIPPDALLHLRQWLDAYHTKAQGDLHKYQPPPNSKASRLIEARYTLDQVC